MSKEKRRALMTALSLEFRKTEQAFGPDTAEMRQRLAATSEANLRRELAKLKTQAIVLGCTELVLAVDVRANVLPVYDTTAIHARACVDWMLGDEEQARAAA